MSYSRLLKTKNVCNMHYFIDEQCIAKVDSVKDLGFIYDVKHDFSEHVKMLYREGPACSHQIFKGFVPKDKRVLTMGH